MNKFEELLYSKMRHNSLLFLEEGVLKLIHCTSDNLEDDLVLSCTNIQISLELAMRAYVLRMKNLDYILDRKQQEKLSDNEKVAYYKENKLKVIEFESLKNMLKGKDFKIFQKEDFKIIDDFQIYRNKLAHFCCSLNEKELYDLSERLMYYVVHIVLFLLYDNYKDKKPADYFEDLLGYDFYRQLWNHRGFIRAVEQLAKERSKNVGTCPICDRNAFAIDEGFCYFCNTCPEPEEWGRADCIACGGKGTVVYDKLNIHLDGNHHSMPGFCQHCESHPEIFECPICGQTHWRYSDTYDWMCYDGHCTTQNKDY